MGYLRNGWTYREVICIEVDALCDSFVTSSEELADLSVKIKEQNTQAGFHSRLHPGQDVFHCTVIYVQTVCSCKTAMLCLHLLVELGTAWLMNTQSDQQMTPSWQKITVFWPFPPYSKLNVTLYLFIKILHSYSVNNQLRWSNKCSSSMT